MKNIKCSIRKHYIEKIYSTNRFKEYLLNVSYPDYIQWFVQGNCGYSMHTQCTIDYKVWKRLHPDEYARLKEWCNTHPRSIYISFNVPINIRNIDIDGGIKSLDPLCTGVASQTGIHPYTCSECHSQLKDLKSHLRKREKRTYNW